MAGTYHLVPPVPPCPLHIQKVVPALPNHLSSRKVVPPLYRKGNHLSDGCGPATDQPSIRALVPGSRRTASGAVECSEAERALAGEAQANCADSARLCAVDGAQDVFGEPAAARQNRLNHGVRAGLEPVPALAFLSVQAGSGLPTVGHVPGAIPAPTRAGSQRPVRDQGERC